MDTKYPVRMLDTEYKRCPRRPILDNPAYFAEVFWLWDNYQRGILPGPGGLNSQSAKLVESFKTIRSAISAMDAAQKKEAEKSGKKTGSKGKPRKSKAHSSIRRRR